MTNVSNDEVYGRVTIDPATAIAGSYGTWRLTYVTGFKGVRVGGSLRVYTDSNFLNSWSPPDRIT